MSPQDLNARPQQSIDSHETIFTPSSAPKTDLDYVSLLSSYKPPIDNRLDSRFPACSVGAAQAGQTEPLKGEITQNDDDGTAPKDKQADPKEQPPAPGPAQLQAPRPGPRPGRPPERPWDKPAQEPEGKPEDRLDKLDKDLGKNLDPNLDKYIKQLDSRNFGERQQASQKLEELLKQGGNAALAHCAKAHADSQNPEVRKRLNDLIMPYVSKELSSPTFGQWLKDQNGNCSEPGKVAGIPEIVKDLAKNPAQQAERQQKLEILSAFLGKTTEAVDINDRLGEYKYSGEISGELKKLSSLDLNSITDADLAAISKVAPNLERLTLKNSPDITEKGLSNLKNLDSLNSLRMSEVKATEKSLAQISALDKLTDLSIHLGDLNNDSLKSLAACRNIEHLDITDNPKVTDQGLKQLQGLQSLHSLVLDRTGITDKFLDHLSNPNLDTLSIKGTKVGTDGLQPQKIAQQLPGISQIVVGDHIPQDKLNKLQKSLPPDIRVDRHVYY